MRAWVFAGGAAALVWVTFPKVDNGSGFPARIIAVVP